MSLWVSYPSMLLLLLVFPLLTPIISTEYFFFPFIVSQNLSSLYIVTADLCAAQVSRLILNLLEANCPLDESIDSNTVKSLRFRHSESTRDTESDIFWGDRGSIEGIHEEAIWLEDSMYFILSRSRQGNNEGAQLNLNSQQARTWSPNEVSQLY